MRRHCPARTPGRHQEPQCFERSGGRTLYCDRAGRLYCSLTPSGGRDLATHAQRIAAVVAHAVSPMTVPAAGIALTPAMAVARADVRAVKVPIAVVAGAGAGHIRIVAPLLIA